MTFSITFDNNSKIFHLTNGNISYIIEIVNERYLAHRYWGRALKSYHKLNQKPLSKKTFAAVLDLNQPTFSLEFLPAEFPHAYQGDYKQTALSIAQIDGNDMLRLQYDRFKIIAGLPNIPDLPQARNHKTDPAKTLILYLKDDLAGVQVELFYSIFEHNNSIIRSSKVTNIGTDCLTINHLASASLDLFYNNQTITSLHGSHQNEFQLQQQPLPHGLFKTATTRGASGPQYVPFIALNQKATEDSGEVWALTLIYSGNHAEIAERDQYDQVRLQIGINPEQFAWRLACNESFYSPQAVLVFSNQGFNAMSQEFHQFTKKHLINPLFLEKPAPILTNSWEMTYYDVNEEKMMGLIETASSLGFEAVVLDDGWFKKRHSSKSSLGDWQVDKEKFPHDLFPIIKKIHANNMKFGIWFEPEMISAKSELIKKHPNWVMKATNYPALYGRNQFFLDLTLPAVQTFIVDTLANFITTYQIDYLKWDMNRHITEPFSQMRNHQHPKAYSHQYMLALYRIIARLTKQFPKVLFENCSSGGGRFDYGMLYYFPQTWASDNTDGLDRQLIQYGASYLFHPYQMTGHVSTTPNHQTQRRIALETRMELASATNMGYELDLMKLDSTTKHKVKQHLDQYKKIRQLIKDANFYRLCSPFTSNLCGWLFESKTQTDYFLTVFRNNYHVTEQAYNLKIPHLNPDLDYLLVEKNLVVSGSELVYSGIALSFAKHDHSALTLHLKTCTP